jgi:uncharacterized protein (DUF3084 family)
MNERQKKAAIKRLTKLEDQISSTVSKRKAYAAKVENLDTKLCKLNAEADRIISEARRSLAQKEYIQWIMS